MPTSAPDILTVTGLYAGYGGFDILQGVEMTAGRNQITGIVGPNGSGKSTAFKAIYGLIKVRRGSIVFDGDDITGRSPQELLKRGIAMLPQQSTVFPDMTVEENLELGMYVVRRWRSPIGAMSCNAVGSPTPAPVRNSSPTTPSAAPSSVHDRVTSWPSTPA